MKTKQINKIKSNALYTLLAAVILFTIAYGVSSFANWNLDCREWSMLARWGVIWGSFIATILALMAKD